MERVTADMIAEKEFSIESKGYNKNEVDNFLDEICEEMDRLSNEIQDLRQKTTIVRQAPAAEHLPDKMSEVIPLISSVTAKGTLSVSPVSRRFNSSIVHPPINQHLAL